MKNVITLLCIGLLPLQTLCQQDCSLEEYALLQDKPREISNMVALNVIQGRTKYADVQHSGSSFYHIQTYPYPKDSATFFNKGWSIVGTTGNRHWKSQSWVRDTEHPSINRLFVFFLLVAFILSGIYAVSRKISWEAPTITLKEIRDIHSWRDAIELLRYIWDNIVQTATSLLAFVTLIISIVATAFGWLCMEVCSDIQNFGFLDFLLKITAFIVMMCSGILFGSGIKFVAKRITRAPKPVSAV